MLLKAVNGNFEREWLNEVF